MIDKLIGQKFGKLTIVDIVGKNKRGYKICECICDCGGSKIANIAYMRSGKTKSCGCIRKTNEYNIVKDIVYLTIKSKVYGTKVCLFDVEYLEKIKFYTWHLSPNRKSNTFYARSANKIMMHRYLTDCPKEMMIDHIDHNGLNNTMINLKICNNQENQLNKIRLNKNNSSGFRGVIWDTASNKWMAQLNFKGKNLYLGRYEI